VKDGFVAKQTTSIVTGGAGFIGSHLVDRLLEKGHQVICIDNLITGSRDNIRHLENHPSFRFLKADVSKDTELELGDRVDYIYHLASPASPPKYLKYPIETLLVNSLGTYLLLKAARKYNSHFLLASTSEVYGDPKEHPQKETYFGHVNPTGIRACYDEGKRFAEAITMEFYRQYRLKTRIIRIFNTYGPRMQASDGRVISNFISQALSGQPVTIYGEGEQTRSFCYVSDMVAGILAVSESADTIGQIVNLGNPHEINIRQAAELIVEKTGSKSPIVKKNQRLADDPEKRCPDIGRAAKLAGWTPKIDLKEGLSRTIEYFSEELKKSK